MARNPIFNQWTIIQFLTSSSYPDLTVLWSSRDNVVIPIQFPINGQDILVMQPIWNNDGNELVLMAWDIERQLYISVWEFSPEDGVLTLKNSTPTERQILFYLGVGDLFIARNIENPSRYYLGEVINGEWFETDFLEFSESYGNVTPGDWYLTADETERAQLSCLFDQTLPSRLTVGELAQVAFTDGTASRLRSEPSVDSDQITLMPEGTEFEVIGGVFCADGYRWWQLALADGTQGWAAEADRTEYFLSPQ